MSDKPKPKRWEPFMRKYLKDAKLVGAEVGVLKGNFSVMMLDHFPNLTLYLIDKWEKPEDVEATARKRLAKYGDRARIIKGDSIECASQVPDELDFVFIDADHSYEACLKDLQVYSKKVKMGGWITGHDYPNKPGVKRAVREFFGKNFQKDVDHTYMRVKDF
jgi:predicted O-methyltransferase YrrM